jgi:hypothetical protein
MKRGLANVLKVVAGLAVVVCLLTPVRGSGIIVFVIALLVALIAGLTSRYLSDEENEDGYWPKGPNLPGSK